MTAWRHPNRSSQQYRVQRRGYPRKRCRKFQRWKIKHGSREAAERAALSMSERFADHEYRAFQCQSCGWWHVGRDWDTEAEEGIDAEMD